MKTVTPLGWSLVPAAMLIIGGWAGPATAQPQLPRAAPPAPYAAPPAGAQYAAPPVAAQYSPRLGIYYTMTPYYGGYGARLTQPPLPGSPLSQPQIQLETGDMITHLDQMPLTSAAQLEQHHSQTVVGFINVRTGQMEARWATLPPLGGGGGGFVPGMTLGVNVVPVQVTTPGVAAAAAPGFPAPALPTSTALRITTVTPGSPAANAGLRPGDTLLTAGAYSTGSINDLRYAISQSGGVLPLTVTDAYGNTRSVTAYFGGAGAAAAAAAAAVAPSP